MPSNPLTQSEINDYTIGRILTPSGELAPYMPPGYFLATPYSGNGPTLWRLFDASYIASGTISPDRLGSGALGVGNLYLADDGTWKAISIPPTPTLAQVTTAGNTTTNAITVGGLTISDGSASITKATSGATLTLTPSASDNAILVNNGGYIKWGTISYIRGFSTATLFGVFNPSYTNVFNIGTSAASWINTGTNFLIGTTTDAGYKLDISGTGIFRGILETKSVNDARILLTNDGTSNPMISFVDNLGAAQYAHIKFYDLVFKNDSTTFAKIFSTGNFGINTTTDAGQKLQVVGNARFSSGADTYHTIESTTTGTAGNIYKNTLHSFFTGTNYATANSWEVYDLTSSASRIHISGTTGNVAINQTLAVYKFDVAGDIRSTTGAYLATSSGSVGIGTTTPGSKLDVVGDIYASGHVIAQTYLKSMYQSGDEGGEIFLKAPATNTTISNGVTVDIYQNKFRIFEQGGTARGFYLDIPSGGSGVGTNLAPTGYTGTFTVPTNPPGQQNLNITNGIITSVT